MLYQRLKDSGIQNAAQKKKGCHKTNKQKKKQGNIYFLRQQSLLKESNFLIM